MQLSISSSTYLSNNRKHVLSSCSEISWCSLSTSAGTTDDIRGPDLPVVIIRDWQPSAAASPCIFMCVYGGVCVCVCVCYSCLYSQTSLLSVFPSDARPYRSRFASLSLSVYDFDSSCENSNTCRQRSHLKRHRETVKPFPLKYYCFIAPGFITL